MVWLRKLLPQIHKTLEYFDKYDYPLTKEELEYWSGAKVQRLPKRPKLEKIRKQREKYSLLKWGIAYTQATRLARLPFIAAIFVTGSLAMNNCKKSDDIDLMVITYPDTLWIVRLVYNLLFINDRRFPGAKSAPDKICTNLWLDTNNLVLHTHSIYFAHEILQAKCIFDRGGVQYQFLKKNAWVKDYLPNAHKIQITKVKHQMKFKNQNSKFDLSFVICHLFIPLNIIFFIVQWAYMKPKMTTERVGPGFAFFHPRK